MALTVAAGACLSRPTGNVGKDGPTADAPIDAVVGTWPIPGFAVGATLARDVDGDGALDLVVAGTDGIYAVPGGPQFGTTYRLLAATGFQPLAFDIADAGGSADPDLFVLGAGPGSQGRLAVYLGRGGFAFAPDGWRHDFTGLPVPGETAAGVWIVDSDGDGAPNVAVTNSTTLLIGELPTLTETTVADMSVVPAEGPNSGTFQAVARVSATATGSGADLYVDGYFQVTVFHGDGGDHYTQAAAQLRAYTGPFQASARTDVDGDGAPELVGGNNHFVWGIALTGADQVYTATGPSLTAHTVESLIAARSGELDGDPGHHPDLVVLRHIGDSLVTDTNVAIFRDLQRSGTDLGPVAVDEGTIPGLTPAMEVGDFTDDDTVDIVLIGTDGTLGCMRYGNLTVGGC